ncbi:hypothetical protein ACFL21_05070 [Patescibacteria group bacterium]
MADPIPGDEEKDDDLPTGDDAPEGSDTPVDTPDALADGVEALSGEIENAPTSDELLEDVTKANIGEILKAVGLVAAAGAVAAAGYYAVKKLATGVKDKIAGFFGFKTSAEKELAGTKEGTITKIFKLVLSGAAVASVPVLYEMFKGKIGSEEFWKVLKADGVEGVTEWLYEKAKDGIIDIASDTWEPIALALGMKKAKDKIDDAKEKGGDLLEKGKSEIATTYGKKAEEADEGEGGKGEDKKEFMSSYTEDGGVLLAQAGPDDPELNFDYDEDDFLSNEKARDKDTATDAGRDLIDKGKKKADDALDKGKKKWDEVTGGDEDDDVPEFKGEDEDEVGIESSDDETTIKEIEVNEPEVLKWLKKKAEMSDEEYDTETDAFAESMDFTDAVTYKWMRYYIRYSDENWLSNLTTMTDPLGLYDDSYMKEFSQVCMDIEENNASMGGYLDGIKGDLTKSMIADGLMMGASELGEQLLLFGGGLMVKCTAQEIELFKATFLNDKSGTETFSDMVDEWAPYALYVGASYTLAHMVEQKFNKGRVAKLPSILKGAAMGIFWPVTWPTAGLTVTIKSLIRVRGAFNWATKTLGKMKIFPDRMEIWNTKGVHMFNVAIDKAGKVRYVTSLTLAKPGKEERKIREKLEKEEEEKKKKEKEAKDKEKSTTDEDKKKSDSDEPKATEDEKVASDEVTVKAKNVAGFDILSTEQFDGLEKDEKVRHLEDMQTKIDEIEAEKKAKLADLDAKLLTDVTAKDPSGEYVKVDKAYDPDIRALMEARIHHINSLDADFVHKNNISVDMDKCALFDVDAKVNTDVPKVEGGKLHIPKLPKVKVHL